MAIVLLLAFIMAVVALLILLTNDRNEAPNAVPPHRRFERVAIWLSVALGCVAGAVLVFAPVYGGQRSIATSGGLKLTEQFKSALFATEGIDVLPLLVGPVVFAALPLLPGSPHQRRVRAAIIAVLLVGFSFIAGFSIGPFYLPSALAMLTAAFAGMLRERS